MPAMQYFEKAQTTFNPPLIANENAYLGDVVSSNQPPEEEKARTFTNQTATTNSESTDPEKPISGGFYRLEKGTPLVYTYTYDEIKIIVDGHFYISDETGKEVKAEKGDVFFFPKGSKITFKTDDFGLGFFVGQRKKDGA
ncbi:EutQ Ethanolamine utilization protein [Pyrenophora tritici-repentis]|uniref:Ethanolamine utilization protein EutQ n=1 Tax=Pyrenophora tritici-repentis TaxID=45151 RepID=A0A2W1H7Q3_9PLEO|nr:ethanolamine utilization protein [Pyrenophora tritici-repentis]KAI1514019.1 Ethanolamine utilization protein EutQ [Pyrenophora tritici-repentis]KAI1537877.1 EutQ Ethanolamine utilization protein [Pyrenophora tritici-repentis]KAI1547301.1 EutQ Ethanolamine utilization protein [Pyrenophora tritici-repentis]KAI1666598.1 ethanolamine utilization protein [Pyrenophora tritici-repentis]